MQAALHANQTVKLPWRWTDCTRRIMYSRSDLLSSMLPVYRQLLITGLTLTQACMRAVLPLARRAAA